MEKITIITQYFYPSHAATAQLMTDLAKGLSRKGYQVNIFTGTQAKDTTPEFSNQVAINRAFSPIAANTSILSKIISSIFFLLGALKYVIFLVPRTTPVLIASNPPYAGILGIIFKVIRGGKYHFLLQDIFPESAVMSGIFKQNSFLFIYFSKLIYLTYKYAENIIVLSTSMQYFLENKYPELKLKIKVIENWAVEDIIICDKQANDFAQQYNIDKVFTVLYSGNLGRLHDIETIIEAAKILKDTLIQFVFIGAGAKTKLVEQAINTHKLTNILLLPYQPRELLPLSLTACDLSLVSLIPGAESIVTPSKLYGMLAAGRGIIAISAPNSYIDELLTTSGCGTNIPPNNPQHLANLIRELANDNQRVKIMGEKARQLYKSRYTFQRALEEYQQILFEDDICQEVIISNVGSN
ncbi:MULTISPECIES: glycosyltransferase family 4 protein [unclassified Nostoc]|uniref:glycosyltransferase family 4 protein n=1 Tax=unclassified Nostoc TaxID=2593658 RepID=UPI002AD3A3A7|nr:MULTISPECIES: glycosyltransferase family 4 protein [unclassified Nostoc]MDZ8125976.1 glycosyltransferase family 4 protein [Nostoc sp. CmiVER01]MDZ8225842.1 glycosyltransferase family 4 protein [Nostoc sp. ChiVER01]